MARVSMETGLLDMPYELLFEIFHRIPKLKLIDISELCSKFRDVVGDTRLWKNVIINYHTFSEAYLTFEELYSKPWPVKIIDMEQVKIVPPVSSKIDQVVKVKKLYLSRIEADYVTLEAILTKFQCTELYLDSSTVDPQGCIEGILPEAFSKQTALEVLDLRDMTYEHYDHYLEYCIKVPWGVWLAPVLDNCKNLKTLYLSCNWLNNRDMLSFVGNLPPSLEKLFLGQIAHPEDSFFELLAESAPNLRELELNPTRVKYPSLLKFPFLEVLHLVKCCYEDISDLCVYLIKFPALKTVYIEIRDYHPVLNNEASFEKLKTTLEPHGIIVGVVEVEGPGFKIYPDDDNLLSLLKM